MIATTSRCDPALHPQLANTNHVRVGVRGQLVIRSDRQAVAPLGVHVVDVVGVRAEEQMLVIHAGRVVAGVANDLALRNLPMASDQITQCGE